MSQDKVRINGIEADMQSLSAPEGSPIVIHPWHSITITWTEDEIERDNAAFRERAGMRLLQCLTWLYPFFLG